MSSYYHLLYKLFPDGGYGFGYFSRRKVAGATVLTQLIFLCEMHRHLKGEPKKERYRNYVSYYCLPVLRNLFCSGREFL